MNRTIALAYAITGLAVAAALVAIIGSTTGLFGTDPAPQTAESTTLSNPSAPVAAGAPAAAMPLPATLPADLPPDPGNSQPVLDPSGAEIVYVDAPASPRRDDDDDSDKKGGRGEREDDDD